jgi:hypothetical protein
MKRKLKWIGVVLVVLLLGFGVALFLLPRDRITPESWEKIQIGTTEKEVESILGGPGISCKEFLAHIARVEKDIGKPFLGKRLLREPERFEFDEDKTKVWFGGRGIIGIKFDQGGVVEGKVFEGVRSADPSFLDRLRDWLGW